MNKWYSHNGQDVKSNVEEIKINLKRQIEDSPQEVKKRFIEETLYRYVYRMFSKSFQSFYLNNQT